MLDYLRLIRPIRCVIAAVVVWIGTLIAGSSLIPQLNIVIGMVSVFLIAAGGFSINDFFDAESDKLNKPNRPLAMGKAGRRKALGLSAALFILGVLLSYFINFDTFVVAIIASGLLIAYSAQLKQTMLISNLLISGLAALAFAFGGLITGNYIAVLPLALMIFLSNTGKEIYKSIDASLMDKRYEENSVAIKLGVTNARIIANLFLIVAVIFSFVPYFLGLLGITYLFFVIISDIVFLCAAVAPVKYSSKLVLMGIVVAIIAFLVGAVKV